MNCSSLVELYIPSTIVTIDEDLLSGCSSLEKIRIPFVGYSLTTDTVIRATRVFGYIFGEKAYSGGIATRQCYYTDGSWDKYITYYIPESLKEVFVGGETLYLGAFSFCTNIETIKLENTLKTIERYAFRENDSLSQIVIPLSVNTMKAKSVYDCNNTIVCFEAETFPTGNPSWNAGCKEVIYGFKEQ